MGTISYRVVVACLTAVALIGCSSSTGGTGTGGGAAAGGGSAGVGGGAGVDSGSGGGTMFPDGGGTVAQAAFCPAYAAAMCDRDKACHFLDQDQNPECVARVSAQCNALLNRVTSGLRGYDAAAAFACVGIAKNYPCSNLGNITSTGVVLAHPCLTGFGTGLVDPGGLCVSTLDCSNGYCQTAAPGCSACRAYAKAGALCTSSVQCDPQTTSKCLPGFADGGTSDGGTRVCVPKKPDGLPCDVNVDCVSAKCNFNGFLPDAGPDVCGFRNVGEACANVADCVATAYCKGLNSGSLIPGICTHRIASGGPCTVELEDTSDGCPSTEACLGGVCKLSGWQMLNEVCAFSYQCTPALYCELSPDGGDYGGCLARVGPGSMCSADRSGPNPICLSGSTCRANDAGSTCVALSSAGGSCADNRNCKELLQCSPTAGDAGTCTTYSMAGSNCDAGTIVCANGIAANGFCAVIDAGAGQPVLRTCSSLGGSGSGCTSNAQCSSSRCIGGDGGFSSTANPGTCAMACLP